MSEPMMQYSAGFDQYVMLLLKLHDLIREGHGDDAEADEVRDQMDGPWEAMPKAEIDLADALSGDLYSIGEDRVPVGEVDDHEAAQFANAMETADLPMALAVLRRNSPALPPVDVAILRGICWKQMHQKDVAMAFFIEALRLAPHDSRAIAYVLQSLIGAQRLAEAEKMAMELLNSEKSSLNRIIAAKAVLLASSVVAYAENAQAAEKTIVSEIAEIGAPDDEFVRDQVKFALLALTMYLEETGRINEAVNMCDRALSFDHSDPYAHELKGALMVKANPDGASNNIRRQMSAYFDVQTQSTLPSLAASLN